MGSAPPARADPALEKLHEVAERIRRRAAAGRPARPARATVQRVVPVPRGPPPPPHWTDGSDRGDEQPH